MDDTRQIDVPTVTIEVPTIAAVGADGPCAVVRVDPTVVTVALAVLDQYPVLLPGAPAPETADTVTHSLRAALAQAGIRPPSG
ncbi:hypothetical protein ACFQ1I_00390 [Kitasatospora arboriphila]